jgi:hypothetical protein
MTSSARRFYPSVFLCLIASSWLGACDGKSSSLGDAGNNGDGPPPLEDRPRNLAVVNSDYASTSIALLDRSTGQVTNGNCINSGTRAPEVTLALSGDVVLPQQAQPGGLLVTLDRTNSALTWIDPSTCTPLRQLDVSTGFYANPHDLVGISATKAYVLRYERNEAPTADPSDHDDGDDLLIIDPSIPRITGRIDLSAYAVQVPDVTIQARPDRALFIDGKVFVVLSNLSADFQTAGHGRLVVIDPATDQVTGMVDIPDLENCSSPSYIESTKVLVVACGGAFSNPDQASRSGIVQVDVSVSPPVEIRRQSAAPFGGRAIAGYSGIARNGALGFGVTFGVFGGDPKDQFWVVDTASGSSMKLVDASDSFTFGTVLTDPVRERVYLTDAAADKPRVHIYDYGGGAPTRETSVDPSPSVGLPPREIGWY